MANVGYATLEVIPSLKGFRSKLESGVTPGMTSAGRSGGKKYGEAAGKEAGTSFKGKFAAGVKGIAAPLAALSVGAGAVSFFKGAFDEAKEAGKVSRVTAKLIETTGQAAHVSASQVGELATRLMDYAAVDDELIQAGENVLLTFRGVRNEVGAGNQIFDRATKAALDLSSVLGTDMQSATLQLGKALNDPIKGVTSLGRAGVQFTAQQKEQIKALVQSGDLLSAQKVILAEVEGQVGGAAGAAADGTDRLKVAFGNLKEAAGMQLMPAVEGFSNWAANDGIPALTATGGAAADLGRSFAGLPGPVKAATGAFVVFRLAAAAGLTANLASGASSIGSAMAGLRIRTMLAADAFRSARGGVYDFTGNVGKIVNPVGRANASLSALRAGAVGAGAAIKTGLGGAASLVGGPWGLAFIAGTATVAHFWHEHQKAKQYVDDLSSSLDKQTGAVTDNTRELVFNSLQKSGALDAAKKLGIGLDVVRQAALGNKDALAQLDAILNAIPRSQAQFGGSTSDLTGKQIDASNAATVLQGALGDTSGALGDARDRAGDYADFMGKGADATDDTTDANNRAKDSFKSLADQMADAKDKVNDLAKAEQKRRLSNLANRKDKLALIEAMQATAAEASNKTEVGDINKQIRDAKESGAKERSDLRKQLADSGGRIGELQKRLATAKTPAERASIRSQIGDESKSASEARIELSDRIAESSKNQAETVADLTAKLGEYTKTLNPNTKAGQENLDSLYSLADQWNNSSKAVRNTKGAYHDLRKSFVDSAETMGYTKEKAKKLADQLLLVPKRKRIDVSTPGMKQALEDLAKLRKRVEDAGKLAIYVNTKQGKDPRLAKGFATGGKVGGTGYGDKQLILADSREWVMNPSASAYYGDGFMSALNQMKIPRFAAGGPVSAAPRSSSPGGSGMYVDKMFVSGTSLNEVRRDASHQQRSRAYGAESFR